MELISGNQSGVEFGMFILYLDSDRFVTQKPQHKDVHRRTIDMLQHSGIFEVNYCLKVHDAHLQLALPILGYVKVFLSRWIGRLRI